MGSRGPQPKPIDWEVVARLASIFCTQEEIAHVLKCSVDTLDNRAFNEAGEKLSDYIKRHQSTGKVSLRRYQWKAAEKGNTAMLIWLGKQLLGQRDLSKEEAQDLKEVKKQDTKVLDKDTMIELIQLAREPLKAAKEARQNGQIKATEDSNKDSSQGDKSGPAVQ